MDSRTEATVPGPVPRFELVEWRTEAGLVAGITGRGVEPGVGFDLGLWSESPVGETMRRWRAFRQTYPEFDSVMMGQQVHGVEVMTAGPGRGWTQVEGIDGWVTTTPGVLLAVTVADCIPVYLAAPRGVALLHAGWRGTAGGILARGVEQLCAVAGADPAELTMHCGVGICGACYEVGSEVMQGCGAPADGSGPWHLALRTTLADQAGTLGLTSISLSTWCSAHHRDRFYSHRASGGRDGRMVAFLGMQPER